MQSDARLYNDLYNVKKKTRKNFKAMILTKLAIFIPYGTDFWWDFFINYN